MSLAGQTDLTCLGREQPGGEQVRRVFKACCSGVHVGGLSSPSWALAGPLVPFLAVEALCVFAALEACGGYHRGHAPLGTGVLLNWTGRSCCVVEQLLEEPTSPPPGLLGDGDNPGCVPG